MISQQRETDPLWEKVTPEEVVEWLEHPATQAVFERIDWLISIEAGRFLGGAFCSDKPGETQAMVSKSVGRASGLEELYKVRDEAKERYEQERDSSDRGEGTG